MNGKSSDIEKIGQRTKNEDMQNRETQHRKLTNMRVIHMDHTKKKKSVPKKKKFSSVCGSSRALS
jgi:hypothetical protein